MNSDKNLKFFFKYIIYSVDGSDLETFCLQYQGTRTTVV